MIKRWIGRDLLDVLRIRRGVHLTGARQTGKTTLANMLDIENAKHLSLDDDSQMAAARLSPSDFVDRGEYKTLIIDEIQKAPELLNAIKISPRMSPGVVLEVGTSLSLVERDSLLPVTLAEHLDTACDFVGNGLLVLRGKLSWVEAAVGVVESLDKCRLEVFRHVDGLDDGFKFV